MVRGGRVTLKNSGHDQRIRNSFPLTEQSIRFSKMRPIMKNERGKAEYRTSRFHLPTVGRSGVFFRRSTGAVTGLTNGRASTLQPASAKVDRRERHLTVVPGSGRGRPTFGHVRPPDASGD